MSVPILIKNIAYMLAAVLFTLSFPSAFLAIHAAATPISKQYYKLDSQQQSLIRIASQYIDKYQVEHSAIPSSREFSEWVNSQVKENPGLEGNGFTLNTSNYPEDLIKNLGPPTENSYVLEFWEGDVYVNYASWYPDKAIGYITESEYFTFGSKLKFVACFSLISAVIILIGMFIIKFVKGYGGVKKCT